MFSLAMITALVVVTLLLTACSSGHGAQVSLQLTRTTTRSTPTGARKSSSPWKRIPSVQTRRNSRILLPTSSLPMSPLSTKTTTTASLLLQVRGGGEGGSGGRRGGDPHGYYYNDDDDYRKPQRTNYDDYQQRQQEEDNRAGVDDYYYGEQPRAQSQDSSYYRQEDEDRQRRRYQDEDYYYDDRGRQSSRDYYNSPSSSAFSSSSLPSIIKNGDRKIGFTLLSFGAFFTISGIFLFFHKTLLKLGNLLFIAGVPLTIGPGRTAGYFLQPRKMRATGFLAFGIFLVFVGWPIVGIALEIFGLLNLFGNMIPMALMVLKQMPIVGPLFKAMSAGSSSGTMKRKKESDRYYDNYNEDDRYYYRDDDDQGGDGGDPGDNRYY